jgi:hypothetical protein
MTGPFWAGSTQRHEAIRFRAAQPLLRIAFVELWCERVTASCIAPAEDRAVCFPYSAEFRATDVALQC